VAYAKSVKSNAALVLDTAGISECGPIRPTNEDRVLVRVTSSTNGHIRAFLAVADGVGGRPSGEIASTVAINTLEEDFTLGGPPEALSDLFLRANSRILQAASATPNSKGMACTLVAGLVQDEQIWLANIGDSRAYLFRADALTRLTADHSLAADQNVPPGLRRAAAGRRMNQVLTRCLGASPSPNPDVLEPIDLLPGDAVLLCSDGLYQAIDEDELAATLRNPESPASSLVRHLIDSANDRRTPDNVSVIVMRVMARSERAA
jgi:protein phosphatase